MKPANPITVLLADDHMIVREGLRKLLESESDIAVAGEASTGREAVNLALKLHPAVVVMDIAMPMLNGLAATQQIHQTVPETKVLILSAHSDDAYVEQVTALGAAGYLIKQTSAHFLSAAIREVHKGHTFFSPAVARQLHGTHVHRGREPLRPAIVQRRTAACIRETEQANLRRPIVPARGRPHAVGPCLSIKGG